MKFKFSLEQLVLVLSWFSGALVLSGLWMNDEVLSEALFCRFCLYPVPFLGDLTEYQAESVAWVLTLVGVFFMFVVIKLLWGIRYLEKEDLGTNM